MTINFGELFINVLILLCILVLSTFVFVPVGLVQSLIRDFILLFGSMSNLFLSIFDWVFTLISTVLAATAFIYMFNKRFDDLDLLKKQINNKQVKEVEPKKEEEKIELPKEKETEKVK
jgi:predicted tellurium resistance membrane protein TerC